MTAAGETVSEAGEARVLERVLAELVPAATTLVGPGDDCAVLAGSGDTVVTTDTMIEGPDFRTDWHSGFLWGWKLAASNLSDVAAMGAIPRALTVAFAVPGDTAVAFLAEAARGLTAACAALAPGCGVVGGDLGRAPVIVAAVTAIGDLDGVPAVLRSGAAVGDRVTYAGELGLSGLGLRRLFAEGSSAAEHGMRPDVRAHLAPRPPISLGRRAARAGATAMLDVSDGLSLDALRLARASRVGIDFSSAALRAAFGEQEGVPVSVDDMLDGGEDHGLLATFPEGVEIPAGFAVVGRTVSGEGLTLDDVPRAARGWDPFLHSSE